MIYSSNSRDTKLRLKTAINYRLIWMANGGVLLIFLIIGLYIKFAGLFNQSRHHQRVMVLKRLFEDPFTDRVPYLGLLTGLSEILWCFAVVVCLFTFSTLYYLRPNRQESDKFVLFSGLLLGLFLCDDIFRFTLILHALAGIPKVMMYAVYGLFTVWYVYRFRDKIISGPYGLMLVSLGLFFLSGTADLLQHQLPGNGTPLLLEDGTKLIGILNVAIYFWYVCQHELVRAGRLPQTSET